MKYATRTNPPPTMLAMEYVGAECGGRSQSVSVRFLASGKIGRKAEGCFVSLWICFFFRIGIHCLKGGGGGKEKEKFFSYSTALEEYMS